MLDPLTVQGGLAALVAGLAWRMRGVERETRAGRLEREGMSQRLARIEGKVDLMLGVYGLDASPPPHDPPADGRR